MNPKRFNLANRLIHWAIAFTFLYILLTVLLRSSWMSGRGMADAIQHSLADKGITADEDTVRGASRSILHPMWETHELAGYVMIGLFIIRMIITYIQKASFPSPFKAGISGKEKFRSWVYIIFYIFLFGSLATAMLMEYGPESISHTMQELHEQSLYYMIVFIVLHTAGVLIADGGKEPGIISKMVSGDKANAA